MIVFDNQATTEALIRVIGVGGCGGNAINNMIASGIKGVDLISINTDKQALDHNHAQVKLQIGEKTTGGKGAGANPEVGKKAAEESEEEIKDRLKGSDMIFITAGMGGGTGTGAAPVVARIARELDTLVVGIVTEPFKWEGPRKIASANAGIEELKKYIDSIIVIPNQKLADLSEKKLKFTEAFKMVDDVLNNATKGIADIITLHGMVNVDFADVKTVMSKSGMALMGIGKAAGENRAQQATMNALNSPLLEGISINGAQSALVNIIGDEDMEFDEVDEVLKTVSEAAGNDVTIIHGVVLTEEATDELAVTVVATGFEKVKEKKEEPKVEEVKEEIPKAEKVEKKEVEPNTMSLPFDQQSMNNDNIYRQDSSYPQNSQQFRASAAYTNKNISCPRGEEDLRKLEVPTYLRMGNDVPGAVESHYSKIERLRDTEQKQNVNEKPTFLRNIMD